jgi:hypothetical protein
MRYPKPPVARAATNLDDALYFASVYASQEPQIIFVTTDPRFADPKTGEMYGIWRESDSAIGRLGDHWRRCYRLSCPPRW